ncbi:predicted RNA-binding protein containing a PIN domain [Longilinea arvoryzae]|uniref:Predicted RNA-binding protein containing a PIN domain n=1 Tax=Longilinea arvoryzae TaxID=360412 RepID=A0A0S7BLS9_9CHLR|nr:NYN domain-containing protein [Longilinea arvoryzae]GAP15462.1 predicted RNA-binding protein containing a PIN domain [Longilinea arvoryzae]
MPYLIDGHNLIPKLAGFSLSAMDDEAQLIPLLQTYSRVRRQPVEVFFDGAPPGQSGMRHYGTLTVHFVRQGRTADDAIRARLDKLAAGARNYRVVSSDRQVQAEARSRHATSISSEEFARELQLVVDESQPSEPGPGQLSDRELDDWLHLFGEDSKQS